MVVEGSGEEESSGVIIDKYLGKVRETQYIWLSDEDYWELWNWGKEQVWVEKEIETSDGEKIKWDETVIHSERLAEEGYENFLMFGRYWYRGEKREEGGGVG